MKFEENLEDRIKDIYSELGKYSTFFCNRKEHFPIQVFPPINITEVLYYASDKRSISVPLEYNGEIITLERMKHFNNLTKELEELKSKLMKGGYK